MYIVHSSIYIYIHIRMSASLFHCLKLPGPFRYLSCYGLSHPQDRLIQPFIWHGVNIINLRRSLAKLMSSVVRKPWCWYYKEMNTVDILIHHDSSCLLSIISSFGYLACRRKFKLVAALSFEFQRLQRPQSNLRLQSISGKWKEAYITWLWACPKCKVSDICSHLPLPFCQATGFCAPPHGLGVFTKQETPHKMFLLALHANIAKITTLRLLTNT